MFRVMMMLRVMMIQGNHRRNTAKEVNEWVTPSC